MPHTYPQAKRRAAVALITAGLLTAGAAVVLPTVIADGDEAGRPGGLVAFTLPEPTGPHEVGTLTMHLIDHGRDDPWEEGDGPRQVMMSIWYPASHEPGTEHTPYLSRGVASFYDQASGELGIEPGVVDFAGAKTHAQTRAPLAPNSADRPVVVYSPGGGMPRAMGTTLVEELASHGFVVVTVDHTFQAPVQLPEGMEFPASDVDMRQALRERVRDLRFVLDQLAVISRGGDPDTEQRAVPVGLDAALDLTRIGMFGHSIGGFATAEAMLVDRRIDAGANLDGSMPAGYGDAAEHGVDRPFMLMGAGVSGDDDRPHNHAGAPDWGAFWEHSSGWKRDVYLAEGEHMSFADLQVILPALDAEIGLADDVVRESIGTVDPQRSLAAQRAYLTAFFDQQLRGRPSGLFDGSSPDHPVVRLIP